MLWFAVVVVVVVGKQERKEQTIAPLIILYLPLYLPHTVRSFEFFLVSFVSILSSFFNSDEQYKNKNMKKERMLVQEVQDRVQANNAFLVVLTDVH